MKAHLLFSHGIQFDFKQEIIAADVAPGENNRKRRQLPRIAVLLPEGDVLLMAEVGNGARRIGQPHAVLREYCSDHFHCFFDLPGGASRVGRFPVWQDAGGT